LTPPRISDTRLAGATSAAKTSWLDNGNELGISTDASRLKGLKSSTKKYQIDTRKLTDTHLKSPHRGVVVRL